MKLLRIGGKVGLAAVVAALLLIAALASGFCAWREVLVSAHEWRTLPARERQRMLYGHYEGIITGIARQVPEEAGLLLFSEYDPALLNYYLFPRKIWQVQVDPETNALFMHLPPSAYPSRSVESFPVEWVVRFNRSNAAYGGDVVRVQTTDRRL